ncbi:MAG TPA: hypothetical protein PKZ51_08460, partial [Saprospiraceae bacterium]|nr:hypothetical protein [Saprospiraceae bacterium]
RIKAKGYGELKILNGCTNGEECTDDEHRFNRRTEFKILEGPTTIEVKKEVLNKKVPGGKLEEVKKEENNKTEGSNKKSSNNKK